MGFKPPPEQYIGYRDQDAIERATGDYMWILNLPNKTALCPLLIRPTHIKLMVS